MTNEDEKYAVLCDFFWRMLHPAPPEDGLTHTSSESRKLAAQVFRLLGIWD